MGGARPPVGSQVTLVSSVATQRVRASKRKCILSVHFIVTTLSAIYRSGKAPITTEQPPNKKQKTESTSSGEKSDKARTEGEYIICDVTPVSDEDIADGWIWRFTGRAHLTSKELQKYLDEGEDIM